MSAFIYKVIVRGKVFGEATTLAEAEAAAKKHGGKVLQEMGKTANPGEPTAERVADIILRQLGGSNRLSAMVNANTFLAHRNGLEFWFSGPEPRKRGNNVVIRLEPDDTYSVSFHYVPKSGMVSSYKDIHKYTGIHVEQLMPLLERHTGLAWSLGSGFGSGKTSNPHEDEYTPVQQALSPFATAWFALMKAKGGSAAQQARSLLPLYRDGTINDRSLFLTTAQADLDKLPAPAAAMARPLAGRASNPPLEHSNAAALLDTVKPGKPQVIHGVKVSRVGSGYSIDRVVLSRELAIKRLEAGGKVGNPQSGQWGSPERHTVKVTYANGDSNVTSVNGTKDSIREYFAIGRRANVGEGVDRITHIAKLEFLDGKTANPKATSSALVPGQALPHPRALADRKLSFWSKDGRFAIYYDVHGVRLLDVNAGKVIATTDLDNYGYATERQSKAWDVAKPSFAEGFSERPAKDAADAAKAGNPKPKPTYGGGPEGWRLPAKHDVRLHFDNGETALASISAYSKESAIKHFMGKTYKEPQFLWDYVSPVPVKVVRAEIVKSRANPKTVKPKASNPKVAKKSKVAKKVNPALYLSHEPKVSIAGVHGRMAVAKFADPYVGNEFINGLMFVDYDPNTLRIAGRQRIATAKGKDTADYAALWPDAASLLRASSGNINAGIVEGKSANPNPKAKKRPSVRSGGVLPYAMPYAGKAQIEEYNEQADMAEAAGDVEGQREALRKMLAAAKRFGATLDAQIAQSLLDDTYKTANPKAKTRKTDKPAGPIVYI